VRIAFCYNLKTDDSLEQAEYDTPDTAARIAGALESGGHQVHPLDVSGPIHEVIARLAALRPDLVFNTAEGRRGEMREALFPCLLDHLGLPYTGAGGYGCAITLDKHLTKQRMAEVGAPVLPSVLAAAGGGVDPTLDARIAGLPYPVIAKPNYEGSGKGISEKSVYDEPHRLLADLPRLLEEFPAGVIIEPFIAGRDATVGYLEALDPPVLEPTGYRFEGRLANRFDIYGYELKNHAPEGAVEVVIPLDLPAGVAEEIRRWTGLGARALKLFDLARFDFRIAPDGRAWFLEANALPSLEDGAGLLRAAARRGLSYEQTILKVVESACRRFGLEERPERPRPVRVALVYNQKRTDTHQDDTEAEYDTPRTIDALAEVLASLGNEVVKLEADRRLPVSLSAAGADLVFNIAEGNRGRNRESQVPALCEILDLPCTGSDAATLAIALDKAVAKKLLRESRVRTPRFFLFTTGRERLPRGLRFPLIAKPNAEGTSKGLGPESVVDDEESLRRLVARLIERYRQPVIVEEYVAGRELTVGLLGGDRPRVLPPLEVVFQDPAGRPVYGYSLKQDFCDEVKYECPAPLTPAELAEVRRISKRAFAALGCRDVARIDLRLDAAGKAHVLEVNPLPGLTPSFSDLCLISDAAGLPYRDLVAAILERARGEALSRRR
jgi:D-alanine-D-alanine ligase